MAVGLWRSVLRHQPKPQHPEPNRPPLMTRQHRPIPDAECTWSARPAELQVLSSTQQAANAAQGSAALVIGLPITSWLAPAAIASAGPITLA